MIKRAVAVLQLGRRRRKQRADLLTLGLAGVATATAGTVILGELLRLARRRRRAGDSAVGVLEGAELAVAAAGGAAQDTVVVAREAYVAAPRHETVLFNMLSGFAGSFAVVRVSAHGIRGGWWPLGNVRVGGRHIHHFVPGILLAFVSGGAALLTANEDLEKTLSIPFGVGIGLTFDEAALLLDLEDVYWTEKGLLSVQASLGLTAILGGTILALRMLRRGERRVEEAGLIPAPA
jgi:hypothetical protein